MTYTKHIWETGEVITADKMNNLEEGISDESYFKIPIVHITIKYGQSNTYECSETFEQFTQLQDSLDFPIMVAIKHGADASQYTYYHGRMTTGYADLSGITVEAYQIIIPKSASKDLSIESYYFNLKKDNTITCYNSTTSISRNE